MAEEKVAAKLVNIRDVRQITEKEKELAKSVWKEVELDYVSYGRNVFKFANFQKHMHHVLMPTLGGFIYNLDHPEAVHEAMKRLAVVHKMKELGLRRENIDAMCEAILNTLKQNLKRYTEEQEKAFTKILTMITNIFSNKLEGEIL